MNDKKVDPTDKKIRIRKNVIDLSDMDYLNKLSPQDQNFMKKFVDEYYCGGHGKAGSLHREAFGEDYDKEVDGKPSIKKELHDAMNAQNRDTHGIVSCSNNMLDIELIKDELAESVTANTLSNLLRTKSPEKILQDLIEEYTDSIKNESPDYIEEKLRNFSYTILNLFILTQKEREKELSKKRIDKKKANTAKTVDREKVQKTLERIDRALKARSKSFKAQGLPGIDNDGRI